MSTKPCLFSKPLTNAERQARYRSNHPDYREKATKYMSSWRKLNASTKEESKEK